MSSLVLQGGRRRRCIGLVLAALAGALSHPAAARVSAPTAHTLADRPCPKAVADIATCYEGPDGRGSFVLAALPRQWNRRLIVHAHGGPRLGKPVPGDSDEDLDRFAAMVRDGYAWVGSTYRRGGFGVRMAAEDVETSRRLFLAQFGKPATIVLHGQSYGGNVAAKLAELDALEPEGPKRYDGVLLTNAILAGGTHAYRFRADLRAVYQYYCRNHPSPGEPAYPLWQGLPLDAKLARDDLEARVQTCTGAEKSRTLEQASRLRNILAVTGIAERQLVGHLAFATFSFRDLVMRRLGGRNPFDNSRTVYRGSDDDAALNRGVARFTASPDATAALAYDADLSGQIILPTIMLNAKDDPVVAAQQALDYARRAARTGTGHLTLNLVTDESEHSRLDASGYRAALESLIDWIATGQRPDAATILRRCKAAASSGGRCHILSDAQR